MLEPLLYPAGPIVMLQVDNEGALYFRDGPYDQDYHPDAIALFREEPSFATAIGGVVVLVGVGIALADARTANAPASIPAIDGA